MYPHNGPAEKDVEVVLWKNYPAEKNKTTLLLKYEGLYLDIKLVNLTSSVMIMA